jgi:hypothetical protein
MTPIWRRLLIFQSRGIAEHWAFVSPLLRKPKSEGDYDLLAQALDELLAMMMSLIR